MLNFLLHRQCVRFILNYDMSALLEQALKLSIPERQKLADEIYQSIEDSHDATYLTSEKEAELARRLTDYEKNPSGNLSWEEIRDEALAR